MPHFRSLLVFLSLASLADAGRAQVTTVRLASDSSFVVVWTSSGSFGTDQERSIEGQRFASNGAPVGSQFQVNTYTTDLQDSVALAVIPDGRFVVVFSSRDSSGSDSGDSIQARRYSSSGQAQGVESQVNVTTEGGQVRPAVAVDADGTYLVVWQSANSPGSDQDSNSIQARGFLANGVAAGNEAQVNTRVTGSDDNVALAAVGGREFLAVWESPLDGVPGQGPETPAGFQGGTVVGSYQAIGQELGLDQGLDFKDFLFRLARIGGLWCECGRLQVFQVEGIYEVAESR